MGFDKKYVVFIISVLCVAAIVVPIAIVLPQNEVTETVDLIQAETNQGVVVGELSTESAMFLGIPFSQPPVGDWRWRNPRDPLQFSEKYWNGTYKRPACPQICDQPASEYSCPHQTSEDCLYLNVWAPRRLASKVSKNSIIEQDHYQVDPQFTNGEGESLPVMVWFYGGNFLNGAGSCVLYDGRFMAGLGDVIVVTTNYRARAYRYNCPCDNGPPIHETRRVAHLGFLVQGTGENEGKGNFGFWDQVKTLEWVRDNIKHFGGDPNKVTLFGQSAGAESIGVHLTSSISDNLFHQAIMESNPFGLPFRTLPDAQEFGGRFTEAAGCARNDMACLRGRTLDQLEFAFNETSLELTDPSLVTTIFQQWSPVIDGDVVPQQPIDAFMQDKEQKKPILQGATVDEGMIFVAEAFPDLMDGTTYKALLLAVFKRDHYQLVIQHYPECQPAGCDNRENLNNLATEYLFICPQRVSLNSTNVNRWWYVLNQTWSFKEVWEVPLCYDRVCHAAELAYLFNVETLTHFTYTQEERVLSTRFMWYWTNFAKYGNPNGLGKYELTSEGVAATTWPQFDADSSKYQALQIRAEGDFVMDDPYHEICQFWDQLDAYGDHY